MKKFLNSSDSLLEESLRGFSLAHSDIVRLHDKPFFITRSNINPKKVNLISGGGSGHEPLHSGFVGLGMLDAACPGQIFTSPTPDQMIAAANTLNSDQGILFIVKNYAGDVMNFEIAAEMLDYPSETVLIDDDVALPKDHSTGRRGVAGTLIIEKIVGAAAETGMNLSDCKLLGDRVNQMTASIGVALNCCTAPALGEPTFQLAEDEMEMGVGIHGERGQETDKITNATEIVGRLCQKIQDDLQPQAGQQALLHINGLGATPLIELHLIYQLAAKFWESIGLNITRSLVGNYTTSLDMTGCSITVTLMDEEMTKLWDANVNTANLRWGC